HRRRHPGAAPFLPDAAAFDRRRMGARGLDGFLPHLMQQEDALDAIDALCGRYGLSRRQRAALVVALFEREKLSVAECLVELLAAEKHPLVLRAQRKGALSDPLPVDALLAVWRSIPLEGTFEGGQLGELPTALSKFAELWLPEPLFKRLVDAPLGE